VIIVAVVVMMLFPVGAWALSFTNVAIIDPGGVNRAKVNSLGQLSATAVVSGSVTATPTPPASSFVSYTVKTGGGCFSAAAPPAGKALVVTSVFEELQTFSASAGMIISPSATAGSCSGSIIYSHLLVSSATTTDSVTVPFPSGVAIKAGHSLDILNYSSADVGVTVNGYLVPSAQCSTGCL
jgi:hypothetical protein